MVCCTTQPQEITVSVEDEYTDVLQNIEAVIVEVYRQTPKLSDKDVQKAVEVLIRGYELEMRGRTPPVPRLPAQAQKVKDAIHGI